MVWEGDGPRWLEAEARTTKQSPNDNEQPQPPLDLGDSCRDQGCPPNRLPGLSPFSWPSDQHCLILSWSLSGTGRWHKPSQGHPVAMYKDLFT